LHRTLIAGPPGTGKTFTLTKYLDKELKEHKTDPQKIIYISFSNAAADEANRRIKNNLYHIGTMHSLGTKELQINTKTQLLKGSRWNSFKNFSQICRDMSFESYVNEAGYVEYMNPNMKVIQYARSRKLDLQQAAMDLDIIHLIDIGFVEQLNKDLINFKDGTGMVEYSDMISQFVDKRKCPAIDVVFLDEAQDLSPLQWDMFFYLESVSIRSYIAGDDDQTIYTFQGANPKIFIDLKGIEDPQIKSRRVPKKIHKLAESIFPYMSERLEKKWEPRDAEGNVYEDVTLEELNFNSGNWMILARTNKMLEPIKEYLYDNHLRFDAKNQTLLPKDMLNAYRVWHRLHQGAIVNKEDIKDLWDYLTVKQGHVERGFAGGKSLENITGVDLDQLKSEHGLRATGSWETLNFPDASKDYIRTILKNGDDLMKPARIKVSTIHGVKGEEADNVVLYTDIEKIIYDSALKDPDPEHRLFFVGITRAKENLYLPQATGDYQYNIGGPIV
jgi:DNA helicase-2/ATP-dependent DNA helicase PcrA